MFIAHWNLIPIQTFSIFHFLTNLILLILSHYDKYIPVILNTHLILQFCDCQVYNLCIEEAYDKSHFHGRVERFPFDDNHVPPLPMIKEFCEDVHSWLSNDPRNIAVVHCMVCCKL